MAVFFLLLAILGGALVGDLVWENTSLGEATMLDRTLVSYPQGWLLAAAAALGFAVALLLVASVSSTKARRNRRRQLRSMKHRLDGEGVETELEHASWLDESFGRREAADIREPLEPQSEPLYEQTRLARQHEDYRQQRPPTP
jgi:hypothetical protein